MRFTSGDYAELLGLYLGDGDIVSAGRSSRLRISLDTRHPVVLESSLELMRRCFSENVVNRRDVAGTNLSIISVYSRHLQCLFPQHGPGPKHSREIELEDWQLSHADAEPWRLLKGLIRSDGCSFINRTGPYSYLSFGFANRCRAIVDLFERACDLVGVRYRTTFVRGRKLWQVRVNRRDSVALLVREVGVKE